MLRGQGLPIELGGGETADCGDSVRTLVVDAVLSGRIARDRLIHPSAIKPGDCIVGLSSTGQTSYEDRANSGIASNGLTLARHSLLSSQYPERYPECVDPALEEAVRYRGSFGLGDTPSGLGMSVGEALLSPTRTFSPVLFRIYSELFSDIHGVIHLTGGALSKVLRFGKGNRYVKDNLFPTPPVFSLIQAEAGIDWREMYQVFNMGQRIELYVSEAASSKIIKIAAEFQLDAQVIGQVEAASGEANEVLVRSENGEYTYTL